MSDSHHQQGAHDIIESFAVGTIELGNGSENEGEGNVLKEVQVRAGGKEQGIGGGVFRVV